MFIVRNQAWQGLGHVVIFITMPSADTGTAWLLQIREAEVQWMKSVPCSGRESLQTRCAKFGDINLKKPRVPSAGEEMLLRTLPPRCEIEKSTKHVEHRHRLSQKLFRLSDHSPFLLCCVCSLLYGRCEVAKLKYMGQTSEEGSQASKWNAAAAAVTCATSD
eukprot:s165_g32.t1